jgi:hypothetical protein
MRLGQVEGRQQGHSEAGGDERLRHREILCRVLEPWVEAAMLAAELRPSD